MKCVRFEIQNFMGIGSAKLDLSDKGLVAIQGVNNKDSSASSNGAGKSSFADGLAWCVYGTTARDGLSADEVVNNTAGKDCQVTSVWEEDDGGFYTITRWRKRPGAKKNGVSLVYTSPAGVDTDLTKGKDSLTQVEIDKAMGCSEDVFIAAIYAGQEKLPNIPAMTDGELKQLVEKASGVDVLVAAYKIARDKLKEAENAQDRWRADHVRMERDVTNAKTRLDNLIQQRDGYEVKRRRDIDAMKLTLQEHVTRARQHQTERDSVDPTRLTAEVAKLDAKIAAVEKERDEEQRLLHEHTDANARLSSITAHFSRAHQDALDQKKRLDNINSQVGKPCDTCGKPYEEHDIGDAKRIASDKLRSLVARARELKDDVATAQGVVTERAQKLAEYRSRMTDVSATVSERQRFAQLLADRKRAEDRLASETAQARRVREQIDALKVAANPFIALVDGADKELTDAAAEFRKSEEAGVALEKRVQVCKDVVKVYGPAGVRAHVLDNVTPFLNDRTADYLGTMSDGNISAVWSTLSLNGKGELVEKFAIDVKKPGDAESFAGLSGGEKRKVRLACALALQDLVASRATKPIELWIGDEIDDAMDEAGLERLMNVLERKARERGTVLVISHNSLNDWIRDVVTVTRDGGLSRIEGCLEAA